MRRVLHSPWLVALAVLLLAALPVLAALSAHREQARRAEALLFERCADVVAAHLRLLTSRQVAWQNTVRMRLSNRGGAPVTMLDEMLAPGSPVALPEYCRALAYAALEDGLVVLRWLRVDHGGGIGELGDDWLASPELGALLEKSMARPARTHSEQRGDDLLTAQTVSATSPRDPDGWLIAWWDLGAMCADPPMAFVAGDRTLTARPGGGGGEDDGSERSIDIGEAEVNWQLLVGKGSNFAALFPRTSEHAIALTGGGCALLLALLAGFATRGAGLRAALAAERDLVTMKDHLLHSVSHEFRTPLSVILSSTELLENYTERLSPQRRAEALAQIREASGRMDDMIGQVLLLGRIEARHLPVDPVPIDVAAFARELAREIETATHARCPIRVSAPDSLAATLDPALLRAVLGNLLSNAVKFSAPGDAVEFAVAHDGHLRFSIRDTGPGIREADRLRATQPFFRAASAAEIEGTGLGLTIAEKCAALLGGTLGLESGPDGTLATLTI